MSYYFYSFARKLSIFAILLLTFLSHSKLSANPNPVILTGNCGETFTDEGGIDGAYPPESDVTYTFCPDNPGDAILVDFTTFFVDEFGYGPECYDFLTIHNGPDTNAPTINTPHGTSSWCSVGWGPDLVDGTEASDPTVRGPFVSSHETGCLTFRFVSDFEAFEESGWEATVSCIDVNSIAFGCSDPSASNYDTNANYNSGACIYLFGCTDPSALNYNSEASLEDYSCEYLEGCNDPYAINYDAEAIIFDGSCEYDYSCGNFFFDPGGSVNSYYDIEDQTVTICPDNVGDVVVIEFNYFNVDEFMNPHDCEDGLVIHNGPDTNASIISTPNGNESWCWYDWGDDLYADGSGNPVELGPFVSDHASGCLTFYFYQGEFVVEEEGWEATISCVDPAFVGYGCSDPLAENYSPDAEYNNGTCEYILGCTNPNANNYSAEATVENGLCTFNEGCTDENASNYDPIAYVDDGSCFYSYSCGDTFYDPGGPLDNDFFDSPEFFESLTYTVCPEFEGDFIQVDFTYFYAGGLDEISCDNWMVIHDGPDTGSPTIDSPAGFPEWCWSDIEFEGEFFGSGNPVEEGPFIPTNPSGCLTFEFTYWAPWDNSGWSANVTCLNTDHVLTALAFHDENENGIWENDENLLHNQLISLEPGAVASLTNSVGVSTLIIEPNSSYTATVEPTGLWEISETDATVNFTTGEGNVDTTIYFPLTSIGEFSVLNVDLNSAITRCFWEVNFWLNYSNEGTTTNDGWVNFITDPNSTFISSDPMPDSTSNNVLFWNYENLTPSTSRQISMIVEMPGVEFLDSLLVFEANIETNEGIGGKKDIYLSELRCAYDPNDKLVEPFGHGEENYTLFNDTLDYTIRFQNTGNDTAFNVVVRDTMSTDLDLSTFTVLSSSHELNTVIRSESRIVEFNFNNILLVDSNANEPESHGFVKYQILNNEGLSENTNIENTAGIYFDFNPPIVTNTTSNLLVSVLPALGNLLTKEGEIDFGAVLPGTVETMNLTIINSGDLPMTVQDLILGSNGEIFTFDFEAFELEGGAEQVIPIAFTPQAIIAYQSNILVRSDVGEASVVLRGVGEMDSGLSDLNFKLNISPNPSNGIFNLELKDYNSSEEIQINVFDVKGKIILDKNLESTNTKIDLTGNASGVYFLKLETAEGTLVKKLIVR